MADLFMSNLNVFNSAMNKAEFKEKFGRVLQYGARMVSGILTDADLQSPSKDRKDLIAKVCRIVIAFFNVSDAWPDLTIFAF